MLVSILVSIAVALVVGVALYYLAGWLYQVDDAIEDRRRVAIKLSVELSKAGLTRLPELLMDYGVGDYSEMLHKMRAVADAAKADPDLFMREFDAVFERVLESKLKTPHGRILLAAKLADTATDHESEIVYDAIDDELEGV